MLEYFILEQALEEEGIEGDLDYEQYHGLQKRHLLIGNNDQLEQGRFQYDDYVEEAAGRMIQELPRVYSLAAELQVCAEGLGALHF